LSEARDRLMEYLKESARIRRLVSVAAPASGSWRLRRTTRRIGCWLLVATMACLDAPQTAIAAECQGDEGITSTFELIENAIFDNRGCTNAICHGAAAQGGLDLRAGVAYENLVDVAAHSVAGAVRVRPGDRQGSLLWQNLAAKTLDDLHLAPLRVMPPDPQPALTLDELELIRLWIVGGAPREGVLAGTDDFTSECIAPPSIPRMKPLPPPEPGAGIQLVMPIAEIEPNSEREVCFASYYDLRHLVPDEFRDESGQVLRFKRTIGRRGTSSHHMFVYLYRGAAAADDPAWGDYSCRGGERHGERCDPFVADACGPESLCATESVTSFGCGDFGPGDNHELLLETPFGLVVLGPPASVSTFEPGVYAELPLQGLLIWNLHAFNLTDESVPMDAWLNFEFAAPDEQRIPVRHTFNYEATDKMNVAPFSTDEPCHVHMLPEGARLFELTSHMHRRGKRFRMFEGAFTCNGETPPPFGSGEPCSPLGYDLASSDPCGGDPCEGWRRKRVGDCDNDGIVTVDEILRAVAIALGTGSIDSCHESDGDRDHEVAVHEIIVAVGAALLGVPPVEPRSGDDSLLYTSFDYSDPLSLQFSPPYVVAGAGSSRDDRALTFCALYDNGYTDPSSVKRKSTSPPPPPGGGGGPCALATHCAEGAIGKPCEGTTEAERNRSCDSLQGSGDGFCDACFLRGGATTDDEMMMIAGKYFQP